MMRALFNGIGIQWRLTALGLGAGLVGALIVVVTLDAQKEAVEARTQLGEVDLASLQMSDNFRATLRLANDKFRHYASSEDPGAWDEFVQASEDLRAWILRQGPASPTEEEKAVLKRMNAGYALYRGKATEIQARREAAAETRLSLAEYDEFLEQSRRLLDMGQALSRAHFASRNAVLNHANHAFTRLRLWVLGLVGLLFVSGAVLVIVIYRDMIAPLQVKLVASQALAERNEKLASLGVLAAGVAHEIRNPLTAIKAALFTQQKKLPPGSPARCDAEVVEREISRLDRILNSFLQFARPSEPEPATILADQPLRQVEELMRKQMAGSGVRIECEETPPLRLRADPAQLEQVLINLVQNAADSIGSDGRIVLRARADRRRLHDREVDVVVLEVADTGQGIAPEVEKRLFDPFFTTKAGGTGLGLSIASRLAQMNGGALQYQTRVNHGSTFGIVLPRVET